MTSNTPLRNAKQSAYEGGIRTPLIARWPNVTKSNQITRQPGHIIDVMATCLDVAGLVYPKEVPQSPAHPHGGQESGADSSRKNTEGAF